MDKLALTGMALAVGGAAGVLTLELIGTAYAGKPDQSDYLVAVGVAAPIKLVTMPPDSSGFAQGAIRSRTLVCRGGVLGFGAFSVGYRCGAI